MTISDVKFTALRNQGHTGTLDDMTNAWLAASGGQGSTQTDLWLSMLEVQTGQQGHVEDLWDVFLDARTSGNSIEEMEYEFWANGGTVVADSTPPTAPVLAAPTNVTHDGMDIALTPATDNVAVTGYRAYRQIGGAGGFTFWRVLDAQEISDNEFRPRGLSETTQYDFYVTAVDAAANEGPQSNTVGDTTEAQGAPPVEEWTRNYTITAGDNGSLVGYIASTFGTSVPEPANMDNGSRIRWIVTRPSNNRLVLRVDVPAPDDDFTIKQITITGELNGGQGSVVRLRSARASYTAEGGPTQEWEWDIGVNDLLVTGREYAVEIIGDVT